MNPSYQRRSAGFVICLTVSLQFFVGAVVNAEDGYRLWLRYDPLSRQMIDLYRARVTSIIVTGNSATSQAIRSELVEGLTGLLGSPIAAVNEVSRDGTVIVGTPTNSPLIARLRWERQLADL